MKQKNKGLWWIILLLLIATLASCNATAPSSAPSSDTESEIDYESEETSVYIAPTVTLSDKVYNIDHSNSQYTFKLDGAQYQMPVRIADLIDAGWNISEPPTNILMAYMDEQFIIMEKEGTEMQLLVVNYSDDSMPVEKTFAKRMIINYSNYLRDGERNPLLEVSNGFRSDGVMEVADLEKLFAPLKNTRENEPGADSVYMEYEYTIQVENPEAAEYDEFEDDEKPEQTLEELTDKFLLRIYKDEDTGTYYLSNVTLESEGFPTDVEPTAYNGSIPEHVKNYKAPTTLSAKLEDMNFEIHGYKYALPVPVTEFIEHGWKLTTVIVSTGRTEAELDQTEDLLDIMIPAKYSLGLMNSLYLLNGTNTYNIDIFNPTNTALPLKYCLVTSFGTDVKDSLPLSLPQGINYNSTREDVIATFGEPKDITNEYNMEYEFGRKTISFTMYDGAVSSFDYRYSMAREDWDKRTGG